MVSIALGHVMHRRLAPVRHQFAYPLFYLRIPLSQLDSIGSTLLSVDRFNLFSVLQRDFGPRDGTSLERWMREILQRNGLAAANGEIVLHAMPRMLGYAFNPIVTWHCHDRMARLRAVLCEVRNTFGERHHYLLAHADGRPIEGRDWLTAVKTFHVSPFFRVEGEYRFRFARAPGAHHLRIDYYVGDRRTLVTALRGEEQPFTDRRLLRCFFAYPFMTLMVVARIHGQALCLWLRNVPWHPKPDPPPFEEILR
jgi:DUF1365 family protein